MVKEPQNFKDADYSYTQFEVGDFAFSGSSREERIQALSYEDEVQHYIEALNDIE